MKAKLGHNIMFIYWLEIKNRISGPILDNYDPGDKKHFMTDSVSKIGCEVSLKQLR